jgi:hypothetical protein
MRAYQRRTSFTLDHLELALVHSRHVVRNPDGVSEVPRLDPDEAFGTRHGAFSFVYSPPCSRSISRTSSQVCAN